MQSHNDKYEYVYLKRAHTHADVIIHNHYFHHPYQMLQNNDQYLDERENDGKMIIFTLVSERWIMVDIKISFAPVWRESDPYLILFFAHNTAVHNRNLQKLLKMHTFREHTHKASCP